MRMMVAECESTRRRAGRIQGDDGHALTTDRLATHDDDALNPRPQNHGQMNLCGCQNSIAWSAVDIDAKWSSTQACIAGALHDLIDETSWDINERMLGKQGDAAETTIG